MAILRNGVVQFYKNIFFMFAVTFFATITMQINGVMGADSQVPCFFIYGDSLADNGNNNLLLTSAKVNYCPYGIDFTNGVPTGRFTNGLNTVDFLSQLLGFDEFILSYYEAIIGKSILKGVNYASGGGGILKETSKQLGHVLSMDEQLDRHQLIVSKINSIKGNREAGKEYLKKCIYHIGIGSNDYLNNYFMPSPLYTSSLTYTPQQYAQFLINKFTAQVTRLYGMGGRKVAMAAIGLVGCVPYAIKKSCLQRNPLTGCIEEWNDAIRLYNSKLFDLVNELNSNYTDAKFVYLNTTGMSSGDPSALGLTVLDVPCCPVNAIGGLCQINSIPCQNRSTYAFWDDFHLTQILYHVFAVRSYTPFIPEDVYPIGIKRLAEL